MAIMKCIENGENPPKFDIGLYSGFESGEPYLLFCIPSECRPDTDYNGAGFFEVTLEDILEETLSNHINFDGGRNTHRITKLLRKYAKKLDKSAKKHRKIKSS